MIGFMLEDAGPSQLLAELTESAPRYAGELVVFVRRVSPGWDDPGCAVMAYAEAWGFRGVLVATDLASASLLRAFPGPTRKVFYAYDLDWTRLGVFDYSSVSAIYADRTMALCCRSPDHVRPIEAAWGRTPVVVPRCDPVAFENANPRGGRPAVPGGPVRQ